MALNVEKVITDKAEETRKTFRALLDKTNKEHPNPKYGKTPMQTFLDAKPLADAKMIEKAYSGREPSRAPSPLYAAS